VLNRIQFIGQDVNIEHFKLGFQHEIVMTNTDKTNGMESIRLDLTFVVAHKIKHCPENFFNSFCSSLKMEKNIFKNVEKSNGRKDFF
jgi:hypothetical protein